MVKESLICLLCLFSLLFTVIPVNAADEENSFNEADYAANIIQKGSDLIIIKAAEGLASIWQNNTLSQGIEENQDITDEYGATRGTITALVVTNPHPDQIPVIKKFEEESKAEWVFLIAVYILTYVYAVRLERSKRKYFTRALKNYDLSENRFVTSVFVCIASYAAPRVLLIAYDVCTALSKWAMIDVMDYIEPSADNAWMFFWMMLGETFVAIPFIIRHWILDIAYAAVRFLIVLFMIGLFQDEILWMWEKFKRILTVQVFAVFGTCVMLAAIKTSGMEDMGGAYAIMFFVIALFIKEWVFPGRITRSIKGVFVR